MKMTIQQLISAAQHAARYAPTATAQLITGLVNANQKLASENIELKAKGLELVSEAATIYAKYNEIRMPDSDWVDMQTLQEFRDIAMASNTLGEKVEVRL